MKANINYNLFTTLNQFGNLQGLCNDSCHFTELIPTKNTMRWTPWFIGNIFCHVYKLISDTPYMTCTLRTPF